MAVKRSVDTEFRVRLMKRALALARKGAGRTSPNPVVGAVIVAAGRVIAEGWHKKAGGPHAEASAITRLHSTGLSARGADMYVTLEPCSHFGKTPPCVDTVISAGIKRVFIGMKDPNPLVSGRGIRRLRAAGIKCVSGILEDDCRALNPAFIKYITLKRPYVTLKLAASLDGRIAASTGDSRWITGPSARKYVHDMRARSDAILTGSATVAADDPELTARPRKARGLNPLRVLLDSRFGASLDARIFKRHPNDRYPCPAIVFTTDAAPRAKIKKARAMGVEVVTVRKTRDGVDIKRVMLELGRREITSVLVEAGGRVAASLLKSGVVDKLSYHLAPIIIGSDGIPAIGAMNLKTAGKAMRIKKTVMKKLGEDFIIEGEV